METNKNKKQNKQTKFGESESLLGLHLNRAISLIQFKKLNEKYVRKAGCVTPDISDAAIQDCF